MANPQEYGHVIVSQIDYCLIDADIKAIARPSTRGQALVRPGDLGDHCRSGPSTPERRGALR
jgi:hypothetical protein